MLDKISKGVLILILSLAVILGAYLGYSRYLIEVQDRNVELCLDLNGLKTIAAFEKKPIGPILKQVKKNGINSIGLMEQTLIDANVDGDIYYAKGEAFYRLKNLNNRFSQLAQKGLIKSNKTYIYAPKDQIRKRIYNQLKWLLGKKNIRFIGPNILQINEAEENLREIGLGLSQNQVKYLSKLGFDIIPRVWNDPRYHLGNIEKKVKSLGSVRTIIFHGEEILGYPNALTSLAASLKTQQIDYGYVEIVKQDGDQKLKKLMGSNLVRVHSIPKEELKKLTKTEVIKRFVRAARERKVRLFYLNPFLPEQVDGFPVAYNLKFFGGVKQALQQAGFVVGQVQAPTYFHSFDWQIIILGLGVVIGFLFLVDHFIKLRGLLMYLLVFLIALILVYCLNNCPAILILKVLSLIAAITFPALAIINSLKYVRKSKSILMDIFLIMMNVLAETMIGIFLIIGLLANYRFMLGIETFAGVKLALLLPMIIVASYFIFKQNDGLQAFLKSQVKMISVIVGVGLLGVLALYIARSGNFTVPVPGIEKYLRRFLESVLLIRPRTKEFLVGYPFIFLAAYLVLLKKGKWLWLIAALATIAPISITNSFCHIHTPVIVSLIRTINGLGLGVITGLLFLSLGARYIKE